MLFDPSKEQFHFPTALIKLGDSESRQEEIVGQKHQPLLIYLIVVTNSPKPLGVSTFGNGVVEQDDLIALKSSGFVDHLRVKPPAVESFFCASHKEGT